VSEFIDTVIEDFRLNSLRASLILLRHRLLFSIKINLVKLAIKLIFHVIFILVNVSPMISSQAKIGRRCRLLHCAHGVVISGTAVIGDGVTIFHGVTIGVNEKYKKTRALRIGNNCYLGAGCKIISCTIGDNVRVAPNVVVYRDYDSGAKILTQ
jgi:serine O-acetyltransferase